MAISETLTHNNRYQSAELNKESVSILNGIDELRAHTTTIEYNVEYPIPLEAAWAALVDSERIERQAGLPPFIFSFKKAKEGRISFAESKIGPLTIQFYELPFEWEEFRWTSLERVFISGPFKYLRGEFFYKAGPNNQSTHIQIKIHVTGRLGPSITKLLFKQNFKGLKKAMDSIASKIKPTSNRVSATSRAEQIAFLTENIPKDVIGESKKLTTELKKITSLPEYAETLAKFIHTRPDNILRRIRPFVYADAFAFDREKTLTFFLEAVKAGFLDMSWDLLCPSCQGPGDAATSLGTLENNAHCEVCNIAYDAALDENVELTFRPNQAIREISLTNLCPASPANTRHVSHSYYIEPLAKSEKQIQLKPGQYTLALNKNERQQNLIVKPDNQLTVLGADELWSNEKITVGTNVNLTLENTSNSLQTYKIQRQESRDDLVTAGFVTSLQKFRRLFGSEVLRPGVEIGVKNVTVLFSDLKSSTSLYETIGDAGAFKLVQDHFDALELIIERRNGAIVKTIGDAVMAVFIKPADATEAGLAMLNHFSPNATALEKDGRTLTIDGLQIKIGLHRGACIALNLNDRLDYFGSTVNLAARLQSLAKGDDMILSQEIWSAQGVRDSIRQEKEKEKGKDIEIRKGKKELKGLEGEKVVYQLKFLDSKTDNIQ